jgi:hypothetical protein
VGAIQFDISITATETLNPWEGRREGHQPPYPVPKVGDIGLQPLAPPMLTLASKKTVHHHFGQ